MTELTIDFTCNGVLHTVPEVIWKTALLVRDYSKTLMCGMTHFQLDCRCQTSKRIHFGIWRLKCKPGDIHMVECGLHHSPHQLHHCPLPHCTCPLHQANAHHWIVSVMSKHTQLFACIWSFGMSWDQHSRNPPHSCLLVHTGHKFGHHSLCTTPSLSISTITIAVSSINAITIQQHHTASLWWWGFCTPTSNFRALMPRRTTLTCQFRVQSICHHCTN